MMVGVGKDVRERYGDDWNVKCYSTNYLRTVLSAQGVLTGFLGSDRGRKDPVKVVVRDQSRDTLNAYDRDPELMRSLVLQAIKKPEFEEENERATETIAKPIKRHLGGVDGGEDGVEIDGRVDWIHLADHFVCRSR